MKSISLPPNMTPPHIARAMRGCQEHGLAVSVEEDHPEDHLIDVDRFIGLLRDWTKGHIHESETVTLHSPDDRSMEWWIWFRMKYL